MPTVSEVNVRFSAIGTEDIDKAANHVENTVGGLGKRLGSVLSTAGGFLLAQGIGAAAGAMGGLAQEGLAFGAGMSNVNSILQLSSAGINQLSSNVLALTSNPGIIAGPAELASALYDISSSGFTGADGLAILEKAALAATAGVTTTAVAAQGGTAVLNAYGLGAESAGGIFDQMFQVVNDGVISFEQLSANMGSVLPVAASLGVGFDEVGAAYAQMTLAGVNASQAETQVANLMRTALAPTDALTAAVQEHGYASAEALISTEGLAGYLDVLTDASGGSKSALNDLLGNTDAVNAALLLGTDNLDEYIAEVDRMNGASDGAGATQKALAKQMQSSSFQIAKAKQQLQVLATMAVGQLAPAIGFVAGGFTSLVQDGVIPFIDVLQNAWNSGDEFQELIKKFPEPLQRTVHAFGSVADSVGDLYRSFQSGGLEGMFNTLLNGGEGKQLATAFAAIGQEAWDGLTGTLGTLAMAGINLAPTVVTGMIELAGDILSASVSGIKDWVTGKIYGVTDPGGTGGPEPFGDIPPITLKDIIIQGGIALMGGISNVAGRLHDWLHDQIFGAGAPDGTGGPEPGGGTGFLYNIASVTLNVLEGIANITSGQVSGWIQKQIDDLTGFKGHIDTWSIALTGEPSFSTGNGSGGSGGGAGSALGTNPFAGSGDDNIFARLNKKLQEAADQYNGDHGWLIDAANWTYKITGSDNPEITNMGELSDSLAETIGHFLNGDTVTGSDLVGANAVGGSSFTGGWAGGVSESFSESLNILIGDLTQSATDFKDDMVGLVDYMIPDGNPFDRFKDWLSGSVAGMFKGSGSSPTGLFDESGDQIFGTTEGGMFSGALESITGGVTALIANITNNSGGWRGAITDAIVGIIPTDFSGITAAFDPVLHELENIWNSVAGWVAKIFASARGGNDVKVSAKKSADEEYGFGNTWIDPATFYDQDGDGAAPAFALPATQTGDNDRANPFGPSGADHAMVIPAPDMTVFNAAVATIPTVLGQAMSDALAAGSTYGAAIGLVIGDQFLNLQTGVQTSMTGVTVAVGQSMSDALSAAYTYASAINTTVVDEFNAMSDGISASVAGIAGIVTGAMNDAANSGAAAAYNAGLSIGAGLANGMASMQSQVEQAAANLANAASTAASAALQHASPSKVFIEKGVAVGEGFVLGIESMFGDASRAGAGLAGSSIPYLEGSGGGLSGGSVVQEVHNHYDQSDRRVFITPDSEQFTQIARDARIGGSFAKTVAAASKN